MPTDNRTGGPLIMHTGDTVIDHQYVTTAQDGTGCTSPSPTSRPESALRAGQLEQAAVLLLQKSTSYCGAGNYGTLRDYLAGNRERGYLSVR